MCSGCGTTDFPDLAGAAHDETSPQTKKYNCIAWAAGESHRRWWPDDPDLGFSHWPISAPRETTLAAFVAAFESVGYKTCTSPDRERGFEKVVLYADALGPQHAARQLANGKWTSKLGDAEDIGHKTPESLNGPLYGQPVAYFRRRLPKKPTPKRGRGRVSASSSARSRDS